MKSKALLHLLQSQTHNDEKNYNNDSQQLKSMIENGGSDIQKIHNDVKIIPLISDLQKELCQSLLGLNDHGINCRMKKILPIDNNYDIFTMISNIRAFFQILLQEKITLEEMMQKKNQDEQSDYEKSLQKLEAEIRQHIRIEQQLKLYAETTQSKLEDQLKVKDQLDAQIEKLQRELKTQSEVMKKLNQTIQQQEAEIIKQKNFKKQQKKEPTGHNISDQQKLDSLQRPMLLNLLMERMDSKFNETLKPNCFRVQTEPAEDVIYMMQPSDHKKQRNRVMTEIDENVLLKNGSHQSKRVKSTTKSNPSSINQNKQVLTRHFSNKHYQENTYAGIKNKQDTQTRQKRLNQSIQQSNFDISSSRNNKTKPTSSIGDTLDLTMPSYSRPYSSIEQPVCEMESFNETRPGSKLHDGRSSCQEQYKFSQTQNLKQIGEYMDSQYHFKQLLTNYNLKKQIENLPPNKVTVRQKKQSSKTHLY